MGTIAYARIIAEQKWNVGHKSKGDVEALIEFNFDSWKLDGCGAENDLVRFNQLIQELADRPILVENCHGRDPHYKPDRSLPPAIGCPYNLYRTSVDIMPSYGSVMHNLGTVEKFRSANESYPGCWAYPDMLQVGVRHALTLQETRSHFGAWAIVSSPLVLSHDVNDDNVTDFIWDIISNREVLAVNQAYVGDSGGLYDSNGRMVNLAIGDTEGSAVLVPAYQYLSKPIGGDTVAVLMMNCGDREEILTANFADVPGLSCSRTSCEYHVRDIWNHEDHGVFAQSWSVSVESHDASFIVLQPADDAGETDLAIA